MSATTTRAHEVVGDGTTGRSRAGARWRRARPWLAVLALVLGGALVLTLPAPPTSTDPGAPDNPGASGSRAAAQVLERQGVTVEHVTTTADAVAAATGASTVLVVGDAFLSQEQVDALADLEDDLVLVDAGWALTTLAPGVVAAGDGASRVERDAACDDPDARAAGTISAAGGYEDLDGRATTCFPTEPDGRGGAYVTLEQDGRRVTALSDLQPLTNAAIDEVGNAALVLRVLGRHDHLVWYVPSFGDLGAAGTDDETSLTDLVPWVRPVGAWLLLVLAVAVVWRARRLGAIVVEPLPVVVRSAEATRGRGRLYRRARAHGHAAAALRAGTAARVAHRLGLPRSADAPTLVDAVARATGRSAGDVETLVYGPPPTDDAGLVRLADDLHHLESEVHRP
ncbi:conserved hypothetical protein [Cellulomonas flavigena DSM 20109]|uniref:DUF4350 domain-containing protein n=1 Tax=Cellulomonas flavigena (strain ATCC 482 / DSM 20109 / BCRC 11376 / JCM 18109 / NBRC 3775 / NCIMB 8073 / NRS 134) TaxID=446466 RepID=D5UGX7_CELFN|nr:DUF4350 domain-containing protein [Cellulomonas flavigena]ADG75225.1 conserved hypothetical protein [Cellulomonas flavigena DSM 20109]